MKDIHGGSTAGKLLHREMLDVIILGLFDISQGGGLIGLPLRASHEGFRFFLSVSLKGVAKVALYCAHRTSTF